jgi:hypothetical protein
MHTTAVKLLITNQIEFLNRGERDFVGRKVVEISVEKRREARPAGCFYQPAGRITLMQGDDSSTS